jgi:predicted enzyme related to lactoylglutathione lyase
MRPNGRLDRRLIVKPQMRRAAQAVSNYVSMEATMARITGIGGVFFKSRNDSAALAAWYHNHLGMPLESFGGAVLRWPDDEAEDKGVTVWHVAEKESQWFSPSDSSFMINYRVDNLDEMIAQLIAGGVEIVGGPESHENGKFAWIIDPDGNKVELWEPMMWDEKNKSA